MTESEDAAGKATHETAEAAPNHEGYWREVIRLTLSLLAVWFLVSFGAGILFREALDAVSLGGAPLGFWFAQNGSIYVFVALIFFYCFAMNRIERKYRIEG